MSNSKISALTAATTPLAGTEVLPVVQGSTTKQVSVANLTAGRAVSASSLTLTTALAATSGGTGTATAFTAGSVVFAGTSGIYNQDNTNFFWDDTNNRVGLGTVTPACTLDVTGGIQTSRTVVTTPAATDGNIFSGTYTPSLTNTTNISASTAFVSQYMRVGNVITVSGRVTIDPTIAGAITLGVSLPVASNFAALGQCGGTSANALGDVIQIIADTVNDYASFTGTVVDIANRTYGFNFTYLVV
jgi:hypothetical protein